MKTFVALDFETANQHRTSVCSIGLVFVENGIIVDKYYELIKPVPNFYSYWNTQVHGLVFSDTEHAQQFSDLWIDISKRIKNMPLVAHNSMFDEGCLKEVLQAYQLPIHQNKFLCTYRAAKKMFPNLPNHKLPTVSQYLGFHLESHHNALADAEACAHIAMKIFDIQEK